jgi:hypothetical protein
MTLRRSPVAPRPGDKIEVDVTVGRGRGCNLCAAKQAKLDSAISVLRQAAQGRCICRPSIPGACAPCEAEKWLRENR